MRKRHIRTLALGNTRTEVTVYEKHGLMSETIIALAELQNDEMAEVFLLWLHDIGTETRTHVLQSIFIEYTLSGIFTLEDLEKFVAVEKQRHQDGQS